MSGGNTQDKKVNKTNNTEKNSVKSEKESNVASDQNNKKNLNLNKNISNDKNSDINNQRGNEKTSNGSPDNILNTNNSSKGKPKENDEIKDYFSKQNNIQNSNEPKSSPNNKVKISNLGSGSKEIKDQPRDSKEIKDNKNIISLTKLEEDVEFELISKNNGNNKNNYDDKLKDFLMQSKKKGDDKEYLKSDENAKELENTHKMLIELSNLNLEGDNKDVQQQKQSDADNNNSKQNEISTQEADEIKDGLIENNKKSPENLNLDNKKSNNDGEDDEIHFDCHQIIFSSKEDIDKLTQEIINTLGERVFKAAYKLVYENVRILYYIYI